MTKTAEMSRTRKTASISSGRGRALETRLTASPWRKDVWRSPQVCREFVARMDAVAI